MGEYQLGVDLGTTYTAAAVRREGVSEIVTLGSRTAAMPTVAVAMPDGSMLVGEGGERRALELPERTARQFKRRLGDTAPILLGGSPYSPQALLAAVLADVVARVTVEQGGPPARVCIAHPANWGPYKRELVRQISDLAGVPAADVLTITEPAAAALHYASQAELAPGSTVAVYDLGGGTFDAAVVRIDVGGAEVLGSPTGVEHLGGIDFDAVVFEHVARQLGERLAPLLDGDGSGGPLLARLREECTRAKEALSTDADTVIGVALPDGYAEVRLTRAELEELLRPALVPTIAALRRAIESAEVAPEDLAGVLLVGGSSRIPLVSELVSAELGRPVLLDAHPKHAVALGAAAEASGAEVGAAVAIVGGEVDALAAPAARSGRRMLVAAVVVLLVVGGLVAGLVLSGDDDPAELIEAASDDEETTTTDDDVDGSTSSSSSTDTVPAVTVTSLETLPDGSQRVVTVEVDRSGNTIPGTQQVATTTVTSPQPVVTTTATTVAPVVFSTPGSVRSAEVSGGQIVDRFPNNAPETIRVTVAWQAPLNLGGGLNGYRIVGTLLFGGTQQVGQIVRDVPPSSLFIEIDVSLGPNGLGENGYVRWEVIAVNGAGTAGPSTPPRFVVPNFTGGSIYDIYYPIWSLGGRTGTVPDGTCGDEVVCSQTPTSGKLDSGQTVVFVIDPPPG